MAFISQIKLGNIIYDISAFKLKNARTLTIGNKGKAFDGSANVSWSRDEIGMSYAHHNDWDFSKAYSGNYVTFDKSNPTGGPGGWINGFVTTHNNYLSSFLVNEHRTANWYVGWSQHNGSVGDTLPTWSKLLHSNNYTDYTVTKTGGGASGTWGINVTGSAGSVAWGNVTGKPGTFLPSSHTHNYLTLAPGNISLPTGASMSADSGPFNVRWFSTNNLIAGQPSQYGFLLTMAAGTNSVEQHQLWFTQCNGDIFHRGTNGANSDSPPAFKRLWHEGHAVTSAVWNDYAECRESDTSDFGYILVENGDDTLSKSTERLQAFAGVSSDTWGFSQGETEKAKTPIAVAGRVLVYTYQDRNNYKPGDCVCAAPGGTVDIMTREEVREWPDRIVGTVSCVPTYEEWGGGEGADREPVKVNGRIWIKVR